LTKPTRAFVVGLVASAERISEIRRNRVMLMADRDITNYVDRDQIAAEINYSRRLCQTHKWPVIDVSRRSIEETAATILKLYHEREAVMLADSASGGGAPDST
jgi:regulator of PEP synthase PpsR (kinase-PPPase family)